MVEPATSPDGAAASAAPVEPGPVTDAAGGPVVQCQSYRHFEVQSAAAVEPISIISAAASVNTATEARAAPARAADEPVTAAWRRSAPSARRAGLVERPGPASGSLRPT